MQLVALKEFVSTVLINYILLASSTTTNLFYERDAKTIYVLLTNVPTMVIDVKFRNGDDRRKSIANLHMQDIVCKNFITFSISTQNRHTTFERIHFDKQQFEKVVNSTDFPCICNTFLPPRECGFTC